MTINMPKNLSPKPRLLSRVKKLGRNFIDSLSLRIETIRQRVRSLRQVSSDQNRTIHLLLMTRDVYLKPAIRCANSIWFNSPESLICIWVDSERRTLVENSIKKFHRRDRLDIRDIPLPEREWQRNKLELIVSRMGSQDVFSDADMIWNSSPPKSRLPLFFVDEYDLGRKTLTRWLLRNLGLNEDAGWRMLNVSVVALGHKAKDAKLVKRSIDLYEGIRNCSPDSLLGLDDLPGMRRMAEQIALSISVKECSEYVLLKDADSYMDGGLAESYYLGAINGYD